MKRDSIQPYNDISHFPCPPEEAMCAPNPFISLPGSLSPQCIAILGSNAQLPGGSAIILRFAIFSKPDRRGEDLPATFTFYQSVHTGVCV